MATTEFGLHSGGVLDGAKSSARSRSCCSQQTERNDRMSIDTKQLHGKFALVTGASSRIGRGIALRPAERGAAVTVLNGGSR
jgi:hypothetical protein